MTTAREDTPPMATETGTPPAPPGTTTAPVSQGPIVPGGVVHVIDVGETTVTFVAIVPANRTCAAGWKLNPLTVTGHPPAAGPVGGTTLETTGAGAVIKVETAVLIAPIA